jgi:hypothetical protein
MAEEQASASAEAGPIRAGFSEHFDSAIVMLVLITVFVFAIAAFGRYIGNKTNTPGLTAFFGG